MTRHNAGFKLAESLATKYGADFRNNSSLHGAVARTRSGGHDLVLLKPHTYMNLSGKAVQATLHWFKIEAGCLLVAHDDVSLPLGVIRFQRGGGAGGQHGVESILASLPGASFDRLKIGVGPDPGGARRADYVLSAPPAEDLPLYAAVIEKAAEGVTAWIRDGMSIAMNKYNGVNLANERGSVDTVFDGQNETKECH